ncbi:MAG: prolyl oligopeptidase family serine peptidase [Marinicellaceae bacterium]
MKKIIFLLAIIASQQSAAEISNKLELIDIFNLEYVSDPQISPDGKTIAYVRNYKDVMTDKNLSNLWMVNFDGSKNRPLTTGSQNDMSPLWSHDGKKLIYKSNADGKMRVYLRWMDTGDEMVLINTEKSPSNISWSQDDKHIAFTMFVPAKNNSIVKMPSKPDGAEWNTPPIYIDELNYRFDGQGYIKDGHTQIFTLPVSGGTPRQLTDSKFDHGAPSWSHDNKRLIFSANLQDDNEYDPMNSEIYSVAINDGTVQSLTNRKGPDASPKISPDGKQIAYLGYDDKYLGYDHNKLYLMNLDGSNSKMVTNEFDRDMANIQWDSKGKGLYFQYDDKGNTKIGFISNSGKISDITGNLGGLSLGRPYNAGTYSVSKNGRYAYTLGKSDHPADLASGINGKDKRLTYLNADLFSHKQLGQVEEIWYKSSFDQKDVQGWIVKPPNFDATKKYPLILEIHGGPFSSYGPVFSAEIQLFAAAGYVVLYTNPRGSTSYGKEFANLIHHNYPSQDYDDLISGVDAVIAKGYINEEKLFVTGGSGGGTLSAWIIGKTDRFKAAVVAKPVINWTSFVLHSDVPAYFTKYWFADMPWENPESYHKRSPLSLVGNVTTPTMLLTGEQDFRTPISESEQYYTALKLQKVESAMVRIPGASHGIASKPSNLIAKVSAILAWFEKYSSDE